MACCFVLLVDIFHLRPERDEGQVESLSGGLEVDQLADCQAVEVAALADTMVNEAKKRGLIGADTFPRHSDRWGLRTRHCNHVTITGTPSASHYPGPE